MNIIQHIQKRADFLHLYNEKLSDLQDLEGHITPMYQNQIIEYATDLGVPLLSPAFFYAGRIFKATLDRRFDELFSAQGNLVRVTYSVNEKVFEVKNESGVSHIYESINGIATPMYSNTKFSNDAFPDGAGLTVTPLTDKYALGFNWLFDNPRANDKRLFFETLKYIHNVWRDTATGAQIADGEGLDRELRFIQTESGELQFSAILNAYQYCKLIEFNTSFDLFNAALLTKENGMSTFVRREKGIFFTEKVEVL